MSFISFFKPTPVLEPVEPSVKAGERSIEVILEKPHTEVTYSDLWILFKHFAKELDTIKTELKRKANKYPNVGGPI